MTRPNWRRRGQFQKQKRPRGNRKEMAATKQLARELGVLRERKLVKTAGERNKKKKPCQEFNYLIIIDFESTCWERDRTKPQEIIEFPAVLLNTKTGEIKSEFHYYVQPQEHPTLSTFCHKLTGICQEQVENGIPLSLCLRKFSQWTHKLWEEKAIRLAGDRVTDSGDGAVNHAAIVTWSDWDLGVCLLNEVRRKQITKAPCFNQWIDLRAMYTKFYGRRPKGLNGALQDVGIEFEGRQHSGLDDSRNTAMLAWRMIRDGCVLHITKSLCSALARLAGLPASRTPQTKTERPQTSPASDKTAAAKPQGKTPSRISHKATGSGIVTKPGTNFSSWKAAGLRLRDPNIPESPTTDRKSTHQKRSAEVTPGKSSTLKFLRRSPRLAGKVSTSGRKGQSAEEKAASEVSTRSQVKTPGKPKSSSSTCGSASPALSSSRSVTVAATTTVAANLGTAPDTESPNLKVTALNKAFAIAAILSPVSISVDKSAEELPEDLGCPSSVRSNTSLRTVTHTSVTPQSGVTASASSTGSVQNGVTPSTSTGSFKTPQSSVTPSTNAGSFKTPQDSVTPSTNLGSFKTPGNDVTPSTSSGSFRKPQNGVTPSGNAGSVRTPQNNSITPSTASASFKTPGNEVTPPTNAQSSTTPQTGLTPSTTTNPGSFTTPENGVTPPTHPGSLTTPQNLPIPSSSTIMKATPPLCKCGRRARRRLVQNPGPNQGRCFFSCVKGTASTANSKSIGCGFFQWEYSLTSPRPPTPAGRQAFLGRAVGSGRADRPFTTVLQAPVVSRGQKRLGVSSLSMSMLR